MLMFLTVVGIVVLIIRQIIDSQKISSLEDEIQKLWRSIQRLQQKTPEDAVSPIPAPAQEKPTPPPQFPVTPSSPYSERMEPRTDSTSPPPVRPPIPSPAPSRAAAPESKIPAMASIDWERFTGVNLFSWIGGFALFLGTVFFVKYSIDHGLLSP
ncbi:MAG: hypothetical protein MCM46_00185 [Candidatus Manganitrophus sp. SB1]|nr:hypothetical protein [Candidatus Manganitrophus morganii]